MTQDSTPTSENSSNLKEKPSVTQPQSESQDTTLELLKWKSRWIDQAIQTIRNQEAYVLGWFEPLESLLLLRASAVLPPESVVVEIGSFCGKSTRWLATGCAYSESSLTCIDTFESSEDGVPDNPNLSGSSGSLEILRRFQGKGGTLPLFINNLIYSLPPDIVDRIQVMKTTSEEAGKNWNKSKIDLLFLDGDHSRARQDLELWIPHLADHGMICLHDSSPKCNIYGPDGAVQMKMELLQKGWKQYDYADITTALTRDPGWWETRKEAFHDHGFMHFGQRG